MITFGILFKYQTMQNYLCSNEIRHIFMDYTFVINISFIQTEIKISGNHLFRMLGQLSALCNVNN